MKNFALASNQTQDLSVKPKTSALVSRPKEERSSPSGLQHEQTYTL